MEDNGGDEMGEDAEEDMSGMTTLCIVCEDDFPMDEMHGCKNVGDQRHFMCSECFLGYANEEMAGGAFEGTRFFGCDKSSPLVSSPGNLPCPHFIRGDCETASIPLTTLFRVFQQSEETAKMYYLATQRVMHQELEQDRRVEDDTDANPTTVENEEEAENNDEALEAIRLRVQAALDRGAVVKCPQCRQPGIKNSHCIHIRCHLCANSWCYCCGRTRESNAPDMIRCRGCDVLDSRMEQQPGWGNFARGPETPAYGALHEFHRQRQAYFVRDVKMSVVPYLWEAFRKKHPDILKDVPTPRRRIKWKELDSPVALPVFGNTREGDILWALRPRDTEMPSPGENQDDGDQDAAAYEPPAAPPTVITPLLQVFASRGGREWVLVVAILIVMTVTGVLYDLFRLSIGFYICYLVLFAILFYYTTIFLFLRMADYFELHPNSLFARMVPDVQFVGRRRVVEDGEGPYWSASGRWRHERRNKFVVPLGLFTFGTLLLVISFVVDVRAIGSIGLMCMGPVVNYFFVMTLVLNLRPLPPLAGHGPIPAGFAAVMSLIRSVQFVLGPGLLFVYQNPRNPYGVFLVMFSTAVEIAEVFPRFTQNNFYEHVHRRMRRSYLFWMGTLVMVFCLWYYYFFSEQDDLVALIVGPFITLILWRLASLTTEINQNQDPVEPDVELGENQAEANAEEDDDSSVDTEMEQGDDEQGAEPEIVVGDDTAVLPLAEPQAELRN